MPSGINFDQVKDDMKAVLVEASRKAHVEMEAALNQFQRPPEDEALSPDARAAATRLKAGEYRDKYYIGMDRARIADLLTKVLKEQIVTQDPRRFNYRIATIMRLLNNPNDHNYTIRLPVMVCDNSRALNYYGLRGNTLPTPSTDGSTVELCNDAEREDYVSGMGWRSLIMMMNRLMGHGNSAVLRLPELEILKQEFAP